MKNNKGEGKGGLKERGGLMNFPPLKREGLLETIKGLIWEVCVLGGGGGGGGGGLIITVFIYTQLKVQQSSFCGCAKTKNIIKIVKAINKGTRPNIGIGSRRCRSIGCRFFPIPFSVGTDIIGTD